MRRWIPVIIVLITLIEFWAYVEVGERLGVGKTIFLTLSTSIIGGLMMQFEGRKMMADAKEQMVSGQIPGKTMLDGMCIFVGGIMLLAPGFITDIIGFSLVFPLTRPLYRILLMKWIGKLIKEGKITFFRR